MPLVDNGGTLDQGYGQGAAGDDLPPETTLVDWTPITPGTSITAGPGGITTTVPGQPTTHSNYSARTYIDTMTALLGDALMTDKTDSINAILTKLESYNSDDPVSDDDKATADALVGLAKARHDEADKAKDTGLFTDLFRGLFKGSGVYIVLGLVGIAVVYVMVNKK